jgi:uncharacterized protein YcfJ
LVAVHKTTTFQAVQAESAVFGSVQCAPGFRHKVSLCSIAWRNHHERNSIMSKHQHAAAANSKGVHGTSIGAGAGALAGAAIGAAGGPVGAAVGGVIGALTGAAAGLGVDVASASVVDPEEERQYWRDNFQHQDHYAPGYDFDDYDPAYALGYSRHGQYRDWVEAEAQMRGEWDSVKQRSRLSWAHAREATRAAWEKVERTASGKEQPPG